MDDELDYTSMSDAELEQIARGDDAWSIGPALHELHGRAPRRAAEIAETLLAGRDPWLAATALDIVFHDNQPLALDYMRRHTADCGIPVLRVIVEMLATDDRVPARGSIEDLLARVRDRLHETRESAADDSRDLFFRAYPDLRPR